MADLGLALRQRNLERAGTGLGPLAGEELALFEQQQVDAQARDEFAAQLADEEAQREREADLITTAFLNAGLVPLAQQFQSARRRSQFDLARRGLQGGSVDVQRGARTREEAATGAADVFNRATAAGEQTRRQGLGAVFGLQQQAQGQNPFAQAMQANLMQGVQNRVGALQGQAQTAQGLAGVNQRFNQQLGAALGLGMQGFGNLLGSQIGGTPAPHPPAPPQSPGVAPQSFVGPLMPGQQRAMFFQ